MGSIVKHQQFKQGMQGFSRAHHCPQQPRPIYKLNTPPEFKGNQQPKKLTLDSFTSKPAKDRPSSGGEKKSMALPPTPSTAPPSTPLAPHAAAQLAHVPPPPLATSSGFIWKFGIMLATQRTVALPPTVQEAL